MIILDNMDMKSIIEGIDLSEIIADKQHQLEMKTDEWSEKSAECASIYQEMEDIKKDIAAYEFQLRELLNSK
jgi:hypothetical protein